jgi:hypothetical protein
VRYGPALILAAAVVVLAGCGGGNKVLARVGDQEVTQHQVDDGIAYLEYEAKLEHRGFPEKGSPEREQAEHELVDLLIRRARFEAEAEKLGVFVSLVEVRARLGGGENENTNPPPGTAFKEATARAALLYGRLYERVTRNVTVSAAEVRAFYVSHRKAYPQPFAEVRETLRSQLLSARRNATMQRWERKIERELPARR